MEYPGSPSRRPFRPIVKPDDAQGRLLSFKNLVELHVLAALRRQHRIKLDSVRRAIEYLAPLSKRPLADLDLLADKSSVLVDRYGQLVSASESGQSVMREVMKDYLARVDRAPSGQPGRFFPFVLRPELPLAEQPRFIEINPKRAFGRPCVAGVAVPTAEIAERFVAGDAMSDIAEDFQISLALVEEAIRFEQRTIAA
ncbi:MAG: DUF433 domain-containing protein [Planctomycetota bacterium]|nr:DUF433 domain-containing protein [Planctomycetota bacterium]